MERFVITLEQAKKLKELGFKGQPILHWYEITTYIGKVVPHLDYTSVYDHSQTISYPAYTVGELGEMLRHWVLNIEPYLNQDPIDKSWVIVDSPWELVGNQFPTEAQARGALLIHLIENKLI